MNPEPDSSDLGCVLMVVAIGLLALWFLVTNAPGMAGT